MKYFLLILVQFIFYTSFSQSFTRQDSLRGTITPERAWWDLTYYHLQLEVIPENKFITGVNEIKYRVITPNKSMQIDLQPPLEISRVLQDGQELNFRTEGNAHFIQLVADQNPGTIQTIYVHYEGHPKEAKNPPWDGGFTWRKDKNGKDFIATSCQGLGASVWWPCKDHMYDEVDSARISVEVPMHLVDASNGRLERIDANPEKKTKTYHWAVRNPINNYGINVNIGDYVYWQEVYKGEKGPLDVFYYALKEDETKARKQFQDVPRTLAAFEYWFGPYPFYEDGYKLVQAPYLGMEHQSSVTYGNGFQNGYKGTDLSGTGWGMTFDFIIVHESGHEWFANNITHKDHADLWIHESFTAYSESLFLEYHESKAAGRAYVRGTRLNIENKKPMTGPYGVNFDDLPIDVYYKGSNMLNTLRSVVNDDDLWRSMLRDMNETFYHRTVDSDQIESYMADKLGLNLNAFFNQYLRTPNLPILEYYVRDNQVLYRWTSCVPKFNMPVDLQIDGNVKRIVPTEDWQHFGISSKEAKITVDHNYYIGVLSN